MRLSLLPGLSKASHGTRIAVTFAIGIGVASLAFRLLAPPGVSPSDATLVCECLALLSMAWIQVQVLVDAIFGSGDPDKGP